MSINVAVAGATGYAGGEILRLLLRHPAYLAGELKIGALTGHSNAGESVGSLMPHLPQLREREIVDTTVENLRGHDVVFLGLPHGHSAEIGRQLGPEVLVIDCAADFRLRNESDWHDFYNGDYAGCWPYGIPEIPGNRELLRETKRVAVPGCFPTTITLGTLPAVSAGLIEPSLSVVAVTGVSGAGKKANVKLLGAETMGNLRAYSPGGTHRHTPEIIQNLSPFSDSEVSVSFTPVLAPLTRGILAIITAPLADGVDKLQVRAAYEKFYAEETFCNVLPEGIQPETQNVSGSNMVHIQTHVDGRAGQLVISAALDNLTKGTGGAAVQCMNLALGLEETAGLPCAGLAP
ncbi:MULTISPECIES: N-acetyl-gamma-glutamyl-phosphate reductase [Corynebacterium]|uniref:N-acetyl-gamma-glutamyl-phosphate reductase n=1 Tax=Corynebacterium flavescens TaxID=28028 RepID=A0A1L7CLM8_CORFL|nr:MULTISPECIES: N-acetyl-gamma-glutamyl-phosphate reductase [Corynebacterium]APT86756.1 N-acetyl-gamma-glutamyl-phosphate reductase [Corynebacterium flavescens]APT86772.1 N-acetyl-gamma-glutamyl-phosphate reductase [Corynebacterium flavescens]KAA8722421.1 N-acetyl-gamma-glutamyl-phosphate reductase [Corynebacterium flavescens]MDN6100118.1 N-acetyl-gamma-glutamyl-phosphate reductase [Corynebacterium flavescens]MDN6200346.1 N-acetyl-gamma-glutamyl-phosphate reductase [Corynebacterium flavescens